MSNVHVDHANNRVGLSVNTYFYDKEVLLKCLKDFEKVCKVSKKMEQNIFHISMVPKEETDLDLLGYEFYNYLLGEMKCTGKG